MSGRIAAYTALLPIGNKPAAEITGADAQQVLAVLAEDPRVRSARWLEAERRIEIDATDFQEGPFAGAFSVGRVIGQACWTSDGWRAFLADKADRESKAKAESELAGAAAEEERRGNVEALARAGFAVGEVIEVVNCIFAGRYYGDEGSRADQAWRAHLRLVASWNSRRKAAHSGRGGCEHIGHLDLGRIYGCARRFQVEGGAAAAE
ncbi:hypothetical protein WV31_10715 [Magnetospirillum sp. ME-1]|uniref:hypothetical protein n=1 Tax=Magnetospirillum sp. ME-1 TaxID=1639348 RepID=UPI000A17BC94|nr:hypothetical protein [Magnetospirillum sp. ME-1]ARJ66099.1 hypothetical protein WV31_10715 [Magnetospirillum sp. ME-1]